MKGKEYAVFAIFRVFLYKSFISRCFFTLLRFITVPDPGSVKDVSAVPSPCSGGLFLVVMR